MAIPHAAPAPVARVILYPLAINRYQNTLDGRMGGATKLRGYQAAVALGDTPPHRQPGDIIIADNGMPTQITQDFRWFSYREG
jgi:hypothetical protein